MSGGIFTRISTGENIYGYKYGNEIQTLINLDYIENHLLYGGLQVSHLYQPGTIMNMEKFLETEAVKAIS